MALNYLSLTPLLSKYISIQQSTSQGNFEQLTTDLTYFMLAYLLSGFGNFHPTLLCIIFYGVFLVRFIFSYEKVWLLILAILLAIGGMFFEGVLAEFRLVQYREPDIFNVPYWLGGVYMIGAFALRSGMRAFVCKIDTMN